MEITSSAWAKTNATARALSGLPTNVGDGSAVVVGGGLECSPMLCCSGAVGGGGGGGSAAAAAAAAPLRFPRNHPLLAPFQLENTLASPQHGTKKLVCGRGGKPSLVLWRKKEKSAIVVTSQFTTRASLIKLMCLLGP